MANENWRNRITITNRKPELMKLKSEFALLDVKTGRAKLARHFEKGGERIPVTIRGYVTHQWGSDDGTSIEFGVSVESVEVGDVQS